MNEQQFFYPSDITAAEQRREFEKKELKRLQRLGPTGFSSSKSFKNEIGQPGEHTRAILRRRLLREITERELKGRNETGPSVKITKKITQRRRRLRKRYLKNLT